MSLRARLLAGMLVVSFVLVAAGVIIARTTRSNLVDRVDQQLASASVAFGPGVSTGPTSLYGAVINRGSISLVGLSLRDVDATMSRLRLVLLVAVAMVIAILGLVVFWVLRLGVRPI